MHERERECVSDFPSPSGHRVHPFLDDSQIFYRFCVTCPSSDVTTATPGGRLQQLMSLFSFSRNSSSSSSPSSPNLRNKRHLSAGDDLSDGRPRYNTIGLYIVLLY